MPRVVRQMRTCSHSPLLMYPPVSMGLAPGGALGAPAMALALEALGQLAKARALALERDQALVVPMAIVAMAPPAQMKVTAPKTREKMYAENVLRQAWLSSGLQPHSQHLWICP